MEEHVGKKRRKEIRRALALRKEANKMIVKSVLIFVIATLVALVFDVVVTVAKIPLSTNIINVVIIVIIFVGLLIASNTVSKWSKLNTDYSSYCKRVSISRKDIKAYKNVEI